MKITFLCKCVKYINLISIFLICLVSFLIISSNIKNSQLLYDDLKEIDNKIGEYDVRSFHFESKRVLDKYGFDIQETNLYSNASNMDDPVFEHYFLLEQANISFFSSFVYLNITNNSSYLGYFIGIIVSMIVLVIINLLVKINYDKDHYINHSKIINSFYLVVLLLLNISLTKSIYDDMDVALLRINHLEDTKNELSLIETSKNQVDFPKLYKKLSSIKWSDSPSGKMWMSVQTSYINSRPEYSSEAYRNFLDLHTSLYQNFFYVYDQRNFNSQFLVCCISFVYLLSYNMVNLLLFIKLAKKRKTTE